MELADWLEADRAKLYEILTPLEAANRQLVERCAAGELRVFGRRRAEEADLVIPREAFRQSGIAFKWGAALVLDDAAQWTNVRFRREDILKFWPPAEVAPLSPSAAEPCTTGSVETVAPTDSAPSDQAPSPQKKRRGRRPHYDWAKVERAVGAKLAADGIPVPGDGRQATLEALAREQFPPMNAHRKVHPPQGRGNNPGTPNRHRVTVAVSQHRPSKLC